MSCFLYSLLCFHIRTVYTSRYSIYDLWGLRPFQHQTYREVTFLYQWTKCLLIVLTFTLECHVVDTGHNTPPCHSVETGLNRRCGFYLIWRVILLTKTRRFCGRSLHDFSLKKKKSLNNNAIFVQYLGKPGCHNAMPCIGPPTVNVTCEFST